jgi:hypothetical protein
VREFRPEVRPSAFRILLAVILPLFVLIPIGALMAMVLGASPAAYAIRGGSLVVESGDPFSSVRTVPLSDITDAREVALRGGRRTAGTALPGLCSGRFSYPDLGAVWQVTDCGGRGVLITAAGQPVPIVLSPPDPQAFLSSLRSGTDMVVTLPPPDKGPLRVLAAVVGPISIAVILMVSAVMLLGPGRMRYLVGGGFLEVRTLFTRKRWPVAGARARAYTPSRVRRLVGTAAPGYYTGLYRESGETTRIYATSLARVVLFEGPARVIASPEDRVGMLRALEEEGATIQHHA